MADRVSVVLTVAVLAAALVACSDSAGGGRSTSGAPGVAPSVTISTPPPVTPPAVPPTRSPAPPPLTSRSSRPTAAPVPTVASISVPAIRVDELRVVAYTGTSDDRPGTRIQDKGVAASPRGARGGVGPGEIGNFLVTAHRTTHGRPFGRLPEVRPGQHILVRAGGTVYDYVVTETMRISFRSAADLARQHAAVPGRPGEQPTRAMITLSTCATPEDRAEGNDWSDELGNPEHRINKIGVLVGQRAV